MQIKSTGHLERIRNAIAEKIKDVPGTGVVHLYERYAKTEKDFKLLYAPCGGQLVGFHIRRLTRTEVKTIERAIENTWQIRGLMALDDAQASEIVFDGLIENLCEAFRHDPTLGGAVARPRLDEGDGILQLTESAPVLFSGVLCHSARLNLTTLHFQEAPEDWV